MKSELAHLTEHLGIKRCCKTCAKGDSEGWCYGYGEQAYENAQLCTGYEFKVEYMAAVEAFKDIIKAQLRCPRKEPDKNEVWHICYSYSLGEGGSTQFNDGLIRNIHPFEFRRSLVSWHKLSEEEVKHYWKTQQGREHYLNEEK